MKTDLKQKVLKQLARTEGDVAEKALSKEAEKIVTMLGSETRYDLIENQFGLLDTIAFRVSDKAVLIIKAFLSRMNIVDLTYQTVLGISEESFRKYQSKASLIKKCLEILEHIRYHQPAFALDTFLAYSADDNEDIAKQAKHGLQALAGLDLDIFYGNEKWQGLGVRPQKKVIEKIKSLSDSEKRKYFDAIVIMCTKMLSPTIEGTAWDYKSVTLKTGAVPAIDGIKEIRGGALSVLIELYRLAASIGQKKTIINALSQATRTPHQGRYGDDVLDMIMEDTESVLQFLKSIVLNEDLQIVQSIEHNVFWYFYHRFNNKTSKSSLEIKDVLDSHREYQVYKILIGFEGIFREWKSKSEDEQDQSQQGRDEIAYEKEHRERKVHEYAASITDQNYGEWKNRILSYVRIESDDLATFPYFGKFLEHLGTVSPDIGLRLLREEPQKLERFFVPLFCGLWKTASKEEARTLLNDWINQNKYLYAIARIFEFNGDPDEILLKKIFAMAIETNDRNTIIRVMSAVAANYGDATKHLVNELFLPAIAFLTEHKDSRWIFDFWYRKQLRQILYDIEEQNYSIILKNLITLTNIDYHAEEILNPIAEKAPEKVIRFFVDRVVIKERDDIENSYDAIPYNFHKLAKPLSTISDRAVDIISGYYDGNYGLFIYRGARLLKNIFPDFPSPFEKKLIHLVQSKNEKNFFIVMAVLRNYEGEVFLHNVCKELVKAIPEGSKLLAEVEAILESTGVVSGEFGFADAYERKKEEVSGWLSDSSEKVRKFAQHYTSNLDTFAASERRRAQEDIELRKYKYGSDDDGV